MMLWQAAQGSLVSGALVAFIEATLRTWQPMHDCSEGSASFSPPWKASFIFGASPLVSLWHAEQGFGVSPAFSLW
jgi:hypothetical protein